MMIKIMLSRKLGELRVTQRELAEKTGIRANTVNELYHDVAERVSLEQLDMICEALNCDFSEIVVHTPNKLRTVPPCEPHGINKSRK